MPRPRQFDEQTVVRAAREAFRRTGYAGTSMSDLAAATGLGSGSIYNTFGDKQQLFDRAFADYCAESDAATDAVLAVEEAGLDAVLGYVRMVTDATIADRDHVGCMIAKSTAELAASAPEVVDRAGRSLRHAEDLIRAALARAQAQGVVDPDRDPREMARLVIAITRGIDALGKAGYSARALRDIAASTRQVLSSR